MYVGSDETDLEIIGGGQNRNNNRIMYDIVDMNTIVLFACQKTNTGQIMICVHETMWLYAQLHVIMTSIDFSCVDSLQLGVNSKSSIILKLI